MSFKHILIAKMSFKQEDYILYSQDNKDLLTVAQFQ